MTTPSQREPDTVHLHQTSTGGAEYSIFDILELLKARWRLIAFITFFTFIASFVTAVVLPVKFEAQALLAPSGKEQGSNRATSIARELATLGAIAGLNLPSSTTTTETAIAVLRSRKFLVDFTNKYELSTQLFKDQWDSDKKQWIVSTPSPLATLASKLKGVIPNSKANLEPSTFPSAWDKYRAFSEIISVDYDTETGLITLTVRWRDPEQAATWANLLINELNDYFRLKSIEESRSSIKYLNSQMELTVNNDIRLVMYQLIEEHTKTIALASVKKDFVFEVLDPAIKPDEKSSPNRKLIVSVGLFFGFAAGCFMALLLAFFISVKEYTKTHN